MIQILNKTQDNISIFISDDEKLSNTTGLVFGLLEKSYICKGQGSITYSATLENTNTQGSIYRFNKYNYSNPNIALKGFYFKKDINKLSLTLSQRHNNKCSMVISITPSEEDVCEILRSNEISKYSRHHKTSKTISELSRFTIDSTITLNMNSEHSEKENNFDLYIYKIKMIENNFKVLFKLSVIQNCCFTHFHNLNISLNNVYRFINNKDIINNISIPSKSSRKRFIELCNIFNSNKVIPKLKINNIEFVKFQDHLKISLFGIVLINEKEFDRYIYFDHPGINFCADFLDKTNSFNNVENKISTEIITRI